MSANAQLIKGDQPCRSGEPYPRDRSYDRCTHTLPGRGAERRAREPRGAREAGEASIAPAARSTCWAAVSLIETRPRDRVVRRTFANRSRIPQHAHYSQSGRSRARSVPLGLEWGFSPVFLGGRGVEWHFTLSTSDQSPSSHAPRTVVVRVQWRAHSGCGWADARTNGSTACFM